MAVSGFTATFALTMSKRRERNKPQNTTNLQLAQSETKAERKSFLGVASKFVLDLAKLVFGGGIVAGWFEEIPDRLEFFLVVSTFFFVLMALGYVLFDMDRNKNR